MTQTRTFEFVITDEDAGVRLDVYLSKDEDVGLTRAQVKRALLAGEICVNDKVAKKSGHVLKVGDRVTCALNPPPMPSAAGEDIPLSILFEDDDVIVLNKPPSMVVHPAPGHPSGTLVNALVYHSDALSSVGEEQGAAFRPGIVHRIDKDTSGVMIVCKTNAAHNHLAAQFKAHTIERRYLALCLGHGLDDEGSFDTGHTRHKRDRKRYTGRLPSKRRAITHYRVIERLKARVALVACTLQTGRTHQIRMHLAEAHAPILGDTLYGNVTSQTRLVTRHALHADLLGFEHPNGEWMRFQAPLPDDFRSALEALRIPKPAPIL